MGHSNPAPLLVVVALAGCGPSNQDVLTKHKDRSAAVRASLLDIQKDLPSVDAPQAEAEGEAKGLDPLPTLDTAAGSGNVEVVMEAQLSDPDVNLGMEKKFDLMMSTRLMRVLAWTGDKNPMSESTRKGTAADSFTQELGEALATRYLAVVRVLRHVPPEAVDDQAFKPGLLDLEAFLYDLPAKKRLLRFSYTVTNDVHVEYVYGEGSSKAQAAAEWARSNLYEKAGKDLLRHLAEETGGAFTGE